MSGLKAEKRQFDEVLFATGDAAFDRDLQRRAKSGLLTRVAPGVYVEAGVDEEIAGRVQRNWQKLAAHAVPGGVVSHLSAFTRGITATNEVVISHPTRFNRRIRYPGLTLVLLKGPGRQPGDFPLGSFDLYWSSFERALLENLSRGSATTRASHEEVEERLINCLNANKETGLNRIRDRARELSVPLAAGASFDVLNSMIGALLSTHSKGTLKTKTGLAIANGTPIDTNRINLFGTLATALRVAVLPDIAEVAAPGSGRINFAFFESYFSNYVEGTKFSVEEAEGIVLRNKIVPQRPKDSHDILGVFNLANSTDTRAAVPPVGDDFVDVLQERHLRMLERRPEARPGQLKLESNYAGTTQFVQPSHVRGTLAEGSRLALAVPEGLARAIYYLFLIAEVHPFEDGNGRLSRLIMNAELSRVERCRIIIPTLFHPQFVDCLRVLTQGQHTEPLIKAMSRMAKWCAQFDYSGLANLILQIRATNSLEESPAEFRLLNADGSRAT
ncbi:Fic family protein [Paraburkholderia phenazinium]|uniref:Transcriptional regulator, AbiEi antitoxin, Type IV TA system n=1 Tax=Paraburkholderia phenazinium TaxID=60549 RepID=A0A1N6L6B7_9BURK|nr:Fic family protein [Paraburkholderia phenazinium]SIO64320.1 Transcriptional regulator, AbiEi antitoxin, Type IV TA system [Paraburkholderia phenazinium]